MNVDQDWGIIFAGQRICLQPKLYILPWRDIDSKIVKDVSSFKR